MQTPGKLLLSKLFRNCAAPKGAAGRLLLHIMNRGHRGVYRWTFDQCPFAAGMRVLDVGCGGGGAILELLRRFPSIRADGVDVSEESVAMCVRRLSAAGARPPGEIVRGDATALPFADASHDAAYAIETVYFWSDLVAGLREMRRVLRPGGFAAVAVDCADGYTHTASAAQRGDKFVGLALDEMNEADKTADRIAAWTAQVKAEAGV